MDENTETQSLRAFVSLCLVLMLFFSLLAAALQRLLPQPRSPNSVSREAPVASVFFRFW